jgi:hypothetical protein
VREARVGAREHTHAHTHRQTDTHTHKHTMFARLKCARGCIKIKKHAHSTCTHMHTFLTHPYTCTCMQKSRHMSRLGSRSMRRPKPGSEATPSDTTTRSSRRRFAAAAQGRQMCVVASWDSSAGQTSQAQAPTPEQMAAACAGALVRRRVAEEKGKQVEIRDDQHETGKRKREQGERVQPQPQLPDRHALSPSPFLP